MRPIPSHAAWEPAAGGRDPIALLEAQASTRLPELAPIRYGRMLTSPFAFFRGGAALMAADLAGHPHSNLRVQLCGDAHLSNFGMFAAPDRRMVFSLNDFDESLPGPFEWDLKRLVASFAVAGRELGFSAKKRQRVNRQVVTSYREAMDAFAGMRKLDIWYARLEIDAVIERLQHHVKGKALRRFERTVAKARARDSMKALTKLVATVDGRHRIVADPPLIVPIEDVAGDLSPAAIEAFVRRLIDSYRRTLLEDRRHLIEGYRYEHAAHKVVGVGSVGTRAWIVLLLGRDIDDPLFLQVKEAQQSVLEPYLGKSQYATHGQRVVEGQRLMQSTSDILLGWIRTPGIDDLDRDFFVRQLWDGKGSVEVETLDPEGLASYAHFCSWTLARAHARSGDAIAVSTYMGSSGGFDDALAVFAESYADQNEADFAALQSAADQGTVAVATGL